MHVIEEPRAPNPRRVRIFLAEKGIEVARRNLDITRHEHKTPEFRRLNPFAGVPVLVLDDGTAISESVAICRYFEELHPSPPLMGEGARGKAEVEMWNRRIEHGVFHHVTSAFRHTHPAMVELEQPQVAAWGEANRDRARDALTLLDGILAQRPFIAGDRLTIADITLLVAVDFMKPARIERPAGLAALARWHAAVSARPSAAA